MQVSDQKEQVLGQIFKEVDRCSSFIKDNQIQKFSQSSVDLIQFCSLIDLSLEKEIKFMVYDFCYDLDRGEFQSLLSLSVEFKKAANKIIRQFCN